MLFLSKDSFYEVYLKSLISDFDRETLTMLYQPIIGADAVALYLSLYMEFKKSKKADSFQTHDELSLNMGFNISQIQEARRKLEAIGLLQTYYKEEKKIGFYKYLIYAPKTPKEFFDDILFKGLLIEKIGEKNVQSLIRKYKEKPLNLEGYYEITDSFRNVFNPNFNSLAYTNDDKISGFDRKAMDVSKGFDVSILLKTLENSYNIISSNFSNNDIKKISELALLYGINEITMADFIAQSYKSFDENHLDFEKIKDLALKEKDFNLIRNNKFNNNLPFDTQSNLSKKIKMMSELSSVDYLKIKQKADMISKPDLDLINELNRDYGLNYSVINALIDYCIERTGKLSKAYVTKIAASIRRENITSTIDCMNYLKKSSKVRDVKSSKESSSNEKKEITDEELDELLSGL